MVAMNGEQASFLLQYLLPTVKREHECTKSVIEAIPEKNLDYRPDPNSKTAMELAWHIVAAEHRFYSGVVAGTMDFTPIHRPDHVRTPTEVGAWYGASFEKNYAEFPRLSGEHLARMVDFRGIFQQPGVAFLNTALMHSNHHRGQLSTYLRAMGGKVPAIYGESYDSAAAKAAAKG